MLTKQKALTTGGVADRLISEAEEQLGFTFPSSYQDILKNVGAVSINGHEVFGLGIDGHLNVVTSTLKERELSEVDLADYIVIENLGNEGLLILLDEQGIVYQYSEGRFKQIALNIENYFIQDIL